MDQWYRFKTIVDGIEHTGRTTKNRKEFLKIIKPDSLIYFAPIPQDKTFPFLTEKEEARNKREGWEVYGVLKQNDK